jgi:hypothetical protein
MVSTAALDPNLPFLSGFQRSFPEKLPLVRTCPHVTLAVQKTNRTSPSCDDKKQNPDDRYSATVVDPLDLADHEAAGGPLDVAGALSHKEKSRCQNNYPDKH